MSAFAPESCRDRRRLSRQLRAKSGHRFGQLHAQPLHAGVDISLYCCGVCRVVLRFRRGIAGIHVLEGLVHLLDGLVRGVDGRL